MSFDDMVQGEPIAVGWTEWAQVGRVYVAAGEQGVLGVLMGPFDESEAATLFWGQFHVPTIIDRRATSDATAQLAAYFRKELWTFDVPLGFRAESTFQLSVWMETLRIPAGKTRTYGQIAETLGDTEAAQAVGVALSQNRLPIFVPCHRVIGADGALVGYSGYGGVETKAALLRHEGALLL